MQSYIFYALCVLGVAQLSICAYAQPPDKPIQLPEVCETSKRESLTHPFLVTKASCPAQPDTLTARNTVHTPFFATTDLSHTKNRLTPTNQGDLFNASANIGLQLLSGFVGYQLISANEQDHDYVPEDGLKKKLRGEAVLYDDNHKYFNFGHVPAGAFFYQAGRVNGFGALDSFLISFAGSAAWEFLEIRELFSINDQIMTPHGGYVIGEALYQTSCTLLSQTAGKKAIGYTLSPIIGVHHLFWDSNGATDGCTRPTFSDIRIQFGLETGQKSYETEENQDYYLFVQSRTVNLPGFSSFGTYSNIIYGSAMTHFLLDANTQKDAIDLQLVADVLSIAYYNKNIVPTETATKKGYEFVLAMAHNTTWSDRGTANPLNYENAHQNDITSNEDFYGTFGLVGGKGVGLFHVANLVFTAELGFYADFTMAKAYALKTFANSVGNLEGQPGEIQAQGYHWGTGHTTIGSISVAGSTWDIRYSWQSSSTTSIANERKRFQKNITRNDTFRDEYDVDSYSLSYDIVNDFFLEISSERYRRSGTVNKQHATSGKETRSKIGVGYRLN